MFCPKDIYVKTLKHSSPNIHNYLVHNMILSFPAKCEWTCKQSLVYYLLVHCFGLFILFLLILFLSNTSVRVDDASIVEEHEQGVRRSKTSRMIRWGESLGPRFTTVQWWLEKTVSIW